MANDPNNQSPIFEGLSTEEPSVLTISFASDPCASLGVKLCNHDNGLTNEMFLPGYASVGGMLDGNTLAKKHGVKVGDHIVAVNGEGFRRFPPDFQDEHLQDITEGLDLINLSGGENGYYAAGEGEILDDEKERNRELKGRVVTGKKSGEVYERLLAKIREIKSGAGRSPSSNPPLLISLERYMWDSRVHSWSRFLSARNGNVPEAMTLIQGHERWRNEFFPIDLTEPSLQKLLRVHAVSKIDVGKTEEEEDKAPVVYIDFAKLQAMGVESDSLSTDVVKAFVVYTETLLSKSPDPRSPKTSQFVDLTGVSIKQGLQPGVLKKLYATFEPNYPETLEKMVLYPVPRIMVRAVNAMLSFVNEHTRKKFIITDDLFLVCKELGWNLKEIETCGSVNSYMKKHLQHGLSFVFD
mmetsp:Transcript_24322/g.50937  ORF Transcript_24322/g.50937 Transcript_24322/m.50937 type:complete len:410 (-) Transcript_24322:70-1299(-)